VNPARLGIAAALVAVALVLQVSFFGAFAWDGVVPDLVLLVVVGGALARGGQFGIVLGFAAGVLLDLAPPADHTAGRWALALLLVGYVAGRVRQDGGSEDRPPSALTVVATVAGCSFVGTSVFALTGLLLHEGSTGIGGMLEVIGVSLLWDVLLTPLVLPWVMALFRLPRKPERARI
jgi:rod shape-determining protein MreD